MIKYLIWIGMKILKFNTPQRLKKYLYRIHRFNENKEEQSAKEAINLSICNENKINDLFYSVADRRVLTIVSTSSK
ncbi:hypothetical protein BpHYR1_043140 [Brachionus plicatilis]|uniref:Uncharacterized protein n=1 Tax=Brachionus plicatilis TaxID=10195 RepID=A0A3M7S034_BRAPC|nr:hypothetical protein BpHYR1_043140 [Brachionus plicatilis]